MARNNLNRLPEPATRRRVGAGMLAAGLALGAMGSVAADFAFDGTEFHPVGVLAGDQGAPALALGPTGGLIVWQDNATDGDGLGISARRVTASGSPLGAAFRVNELGAGDQEKPQVAVLPDGGAIIAWQGGELGAQSVYARVLGPDGVFKTGDILLSTGTDHCEDVCLATLSDGRVAVGWVSDSADGNMQGLFIRRIGSDGVPVMELIRANQYTQYNQRSISIAPTSGGGFIATWISEQQSGPLKADVYARGFSSLGTAVGGEFRVNPSSSVCGTPVVSAAPDGALWFLWSERLPTADGRGSWEVMLRRFDRQLRPVGQPRLLNSATSGEQTGPKVAFAGDSAMVVWTSDQVDGSGKGIAGAVFGIDGSPASSEWVVNSTKHRDQIEPVIGSGGFQTWVAVWTDWTGYVSGTDLFAQRVGPEAAPLEALAAVFGEGVSSWQVSYSWLAPSGNAVTEYEVSFDEGPAIAVDQNFWTSPDVLPGTTHAIRVRYTHQDGRVSPWSNPVEARSWGKDQNGDGLPDDWQQSHFGTDPLSWPAPADDSDGDGVSDRNEFLAGTDPADGSDVLRVTVSPGAQGLYLKWNSKPGAFYQLQNSPDLGVWGNVGSPRLAAGVEDGMILAGESASAYYRIKRVR